MAKNQKNTLNDLNEFLKNAPMENEDDSKNDYLRTKPHTLVEVDKVEQNYKEFDDSDWSELRIVSEIKALAEKNQEDVRFALFRIIQKILSDKEQPNSSDLMLANMAIYLEHAEMRVK
jgi:hypothetical protein